jgi:N-acetyl-beta-hexosaminidase
MSKANWKNGNKSNSNTDIAEGSDAIKYIAGIEAAIWGESIRSFCDIQFLLFPHLTGAAQKAWSPSPAGDGREGAWEYLSPVLVLPIIPLA